MGKTRHAQHDTDSLGREIASRGAKALQMLSPWIQSLVAQRATRDTSDKGRTSDASAIAGLIGQQGLGITWERSGRVWLPDAGSVSPRSVEAFAQEMVQRHPGRPLRYQPAVTDSAPSELALAPVRAEPRTELPSAESTSAGITWDPAHDFGAEPQLGSPPPIQPRMTAQRAPMQKKNIRPASRVEEIVSKERAPAAEMSSDDTKPAEDPNATQSESGCAQQENERSEKKLDDLAQQVYPLVRRMIRLESERRFG